MKNLFQPGDKKEYETIVKKEDTASFHGDTVHPVYSTFSLARDAEWAGRQFVLDMKDNDEEGIGTMILVEHLAPAPLNSKIKIESTVESINGNEIICAFEVFAGDKLIAKGRQGQKILKKEKIESLITKSDDIR